MSEEVNVAALVEAVSNATNAEKLQWQVESNNQYSAPIPGQGKVVIAANEQRNTYYFTIYDAAGKAVESFDDENAPFEDAYSVLSDLYDNARNKARGISKTIQGMLNALKSPGR